MLSRVFYERVLTLIIGSYIGYYFTLKMVKELMNMELECEEIPNKYKNMILTNHEKYLISSIVNSDDISITFEDIKGIDNVKRDINKLIINPMNNYKINKGTDITVIVALISEYVNDPC